MSWTVQPYPIWNSNATIVIEDRRLMTEKDEKEEQRTQRRTEET